MALTIYRWDDVDAPALGNGLESVLDACLVNGYGSKAAAGWTKEFSATPYYVYRQGAGSHKRYLQLNGVASLGSIPAYGYESMTGANAGLVGKFPPSDGYSYFNIASSGSSAWSSPWLLAADSKRFFFWTNRNSLAEGLASTVAQFSFYFGDILSFIPGDNYNTFLLGAYSATSSHFGFVTTTAGSSGDSAHGIARDYTGTAPLVCAKAMGVGATAANAPGIYGGDYPDPITGGMLLTPWFVSEATGRVLRGRIPGIWSPHHYLPANSGDTFTGKAGTSIAGKTFLLLDVFGTVSSRARIALEISDTWEDSLWPT